MPPVIVSATASAGLKNTGNAPLAVVFMGAAKDYDDTGLTYVSMLGVCVCVCMCVCVHVHVRACVYVYVCVCA